MLKLLYLAPFLMALGLCNSEDNPSKFEEECPYYLWVQGSASHILCVPVNVYPNKQKYNIGDTLFISVNMSDSIKDLMTRKIFYMPNFPFDGGLKLWRFKEGMTWDYGFLHNEVHIDTQFQPKLDLGGRDHRIYFDFNESDHRYQFEMYIVFKSAGRYIFQMEDYIDRYPPEIELIYEFEGKCPTFGYRVAKVLEGNDYLESFKEELLYIDKELYNDLWGTIEGGNRRDILGDSDGLFWEWTATYCFEVE